LPWRTQAPGAARIFCDITLPNGEPTPSDPRYVLKRTLAKVNAMGFTCYTHPELEFFLFDKDLQPVDNGGYFDQTPSAIGHDFRRAAITMLEAMGVSVEFSHHEGAPGQQEIDLRDADALSTADNIMTFRYVVKEVAIEHGVKASFMPKPFTNYAGSGMHTHFSLFKGEENVFYDAASPDHLSSTAKYFIAGILKHAREFSLITNQWVNSYKRLHGGDEAPSLADWDQSNRNSLIRIPSYKPKKAHSTRIEVRSPDAACNPYLAFAVIIASGLAGIEGKYELNERDYQTSLPQDLDEAIKSMESSKLVRETLGEDVFEYVLRNKRAEWEEYRRQVFTYEMDRYLPIL
jgi:glutamine synthetase